jgi:hypothetical protein
VKAVRAARNSRIHCHQDRQHDGAAILARQPGEAFVRGSASVQ